MPTVLHIDDETRSAIDLKACGVYRYAEDPSTDIWCVCYAFDDEEPEAWVPGMPIPERVIEHVVTGGLLVAHNKDFERIMWRHVLGPRYGWPEPVLEQWRCTAARAAAMSLPRALGDVAYVLGCAQQKDEEGWRLMMQMCKPRKLIPPNAPEYKIYRDKLGVATNTPEMTLLPNGSIILWAYSKEKLDRLIVYCKQDVRSERAVDKKLLPIPVCEERIFLIDALINDRGLRIDIPTVRYCRMLVAAAMEDLEKQMRALTGGYCGPTQVAAITAWLEMQGVQTDSLDAEALEQLLSQEDLPARVRRVLEIRQEASRSSTAKLDAMLKRIGLNGRVCGSFMYHGAHTGRWTGVGFQPQNLMRPLDDALSIRFAIKLLAENSPADFIEATIGHPILTVIAECMRGMIQARPGYDYVTADFANIEGRVQAWLANEEWKLQAFRDYDTIIYDENGKPQKDQWGDTLRKGRDLYLLAIEGANNVPAGTYNKKSPERQHGKVIELSMGYQGGIRAFFNMAKNYHVHVPPKRANELKVGWRTKHPKIVDTWEELDACAFQAVLNPGKAFWACNGKIGFVVSGYFLFMRLPSGRMLVYCRPEIKVQRKVIETLDENGNVVKSVMEREAVSYWAVNSVTKKWSRHYGYGGHWFENAVQAVSRDLLTEAMQRAEDAGYPIVMHAHDEIVSEVPKDFGDLKAFEQLMAQLPAWAEGCPVTAEGWRGERYRK